MSHSAFLDHAPRGGCVRCARGSLTSPLQMSSFSFTSEANPAGNKILRLVSHANAIISELLRLSEHIPEPFRIASRYSPVIMDAKYFERDDWFEEKIHSSGELLDLDHEFRDNHLEILTRFYHLFESIFKYLQDFKQWLHELEEGFFVHLTLDAVLNNAEGKQLVAEAVYLFGTMLLLLDRKIPGPVRERMLVAVYRYQGPAEVPLVDDVSVIVCCVVLCAVCGCVVIFDMPEVRCANCWRARASCQARSPLFPRTIQRRSSRALSWTLWW